MSFVLDGDWYQVIEVKGHSVPSEGLRSGTCRITSNDGLLYLSADTINFTTKTQSSMWTSKRVFQRDSDIDVIYEHQSLAEDGFGRGLMELSIHHSQNMLKGMFWDLAPGSNRGWIRLYQTQDEADRYLASIIERNTHNFRHQNSSRDVKNREKVEVFICYSHDDAEYLDRKSLLGFLSGLEKEGFKFWYDEAIKTSEDWDDSIKKKMEESDIAITLVSQSFLNSRYCQDVEVARFIELRQSQGMKIFPVILSDCDWEQYSWLKTIQVLPRGRKTIERHYQDKGSRAYIFKTILEELREIGMDVIREKSNNL